MDGIQAIVEGYLREFKSEKQRLRQLLEQINSANADAELTSKKNQVGHVTASAFVISRRTKKVLRLYRPEFGMYLQPGGHVHDGDKSLLDAARRQVQDKTGLKELQYLPYHYDPKLPIDIDTHSIAADNRSDEERHSHHDFRFILLCESEESLPVNHRWDDLSELGRLVTAAMAVEKIRQLLSREFRQKRFYEEVVEYIQPCKRVGAVVVTHFLPDALEYLNALDLIASVGLVIPKPRSKVDAVLKTVSTKYQVEEYKRTDVAKIEVAKSIVRSLSGALVFFDIGGWFSNVINALHKEFPDNVLGIVEDTENGHKRYEQLGHWNTPVVSVARSPLKENEDFLVGQSILFSADAILRECGKLIDYLSCTVIGYGKIGRSIAHHLVLRKIRPSVLEKIPVLRLQAYNRLCKVPSREDAIACSDVIFSTTGMHALSLSDFRKVKQGCFIFSATSADDEFDLRYLDGEYDKELVLGTQGPYVTKYFNTNNYFYLVNEGNAVNFLHRAVLGDFIHLVRAEMMCAYKKIVVGGVSPGILTVEQAVRDYLSELWLQIFAE